MAMILVPNEGPIIFKDGSIEKEIKGTLSIAYAVQILREAMNESDPDSDGKSLKE